MWASLRTRPLPWNRDGGRLPSAFHIGRPKRELVLPHPSSSCSAPLSPFRTMHSMHPSPARPMGPRIHRPSSPPNALKLPEISPLNINRRPSATRLAIPTQNANAVNGNGPAQVQQEQPPSLLSLPSLSPPARSRTPTPTISLQIPGSAPAGRPKLKLPAMDFGESAFAGGYAGGPNTQNGSPHLLSSSTDGPGEATIKPQLTISPQPRPPPISMDNIRQTVEEFDQWSDDVLEEQTRLGEGAGGVVHKVRDKRTGLIMARKTITTHEAPMKQLLREIKITSSTEHVNIIHFFGAYISPSSSEVKVLMEFCEGGSLESVGKKMRQIDARVSEKVAGRLAEGVSWFSRFVPDVCDGASVISP